MAESSDSKPAFMETCVGGEVPEAMQSGEKGEGRGGEEEEEVGDDGVGVWENVELTANGSDLFPMTSNEPAASEVPPPAVDDVMTEAGSAKLGKRSRDPSSKCERRYFPGNVR